MHQEDGQQLPRLARGMVEGLPQGLLAFDGSERLCYANHAARTLLAEVASIRVERLSDLGLVFGRLESLDGSSVVESDAPWERLQRGEWFRGYDLRASAERTGERRIYTFSGYGIDRSLGAGATQVLVVDRPGDRLESESLLRTAFEQGPVASSILGLDGRIMDANPALLELLGMERSQLTGRRIDELGFAVNDEVIDCIQDLLERGESSERIELVLRRPNAPPLTMLAWFRPVRLVGQMCLLGVYFDMTEQKQLEVRLRRATESVLRSASEFSRSVVQQLELLRGESLSRDADGEIRLLTRREREVITRVGAGLSNIRIADELSLTPQTIRNYVTRIYRKIGATNRAEAIVWARERGLVEGG